MSENFKTFAVVNPHSANGRTARKWPAIAAALRGAVGTFDFAHTTRPMEAPKLAREALYAGYEMIVSVGGDGNNNEVINGFFVDDKPVNPDAVFAVIPGGTGGDLARILGVRDLTPKKIAETLKGREAVRTDVGKITLVDHDGKETVRYFINIASLGIGGEVDAIVNRSSKALGGKLSFMIGSLRGFFSYKNKPVRFRIDDGEEMEDRVFLITAALGRYFGGGMQVAPLSEHNDGLFDIMVLGDLSFGGALKLQSKIYKGKHLAMPKVKRYQGRKLVATSTEKVYLDVDGEQPGVLPATFEILPGAVRMKQLKP